MAKKNEPSQEFQERKRLVELDEKLTLLKHKLSMEQLEYKRETNRLMHERELERGRIKNAGIRKNLFYKQKALNG